MKASQRNGEEGERRNKDVKLDMGWSECRKCLNSAEIRQDLRLLEGRVRQLESAEPPIWLQKWDGFCGEQRARSVDEIYGS